MTVISSFLEAYRDRPEIARYRLGGDYATLLLTPRFKASRHVIFLLMPEGQSEPTLVAKLPRLPQASDSLEREASILQLIQTMRREKLDSVPQVIAYENYCGYPILVETAINGILMDNRYIRHHLDACCRAVLDWLIAIQPQDRAQLHTDAYKRLVRAPLRYFGEYFPLNEEESELLAATEDLIAPLTKMLLPMVIEHGDLSHPNIIVNAQGKVGVIDWELAIAEGLPACDLFFFLTYAAFARDRAGKTGDHVGAFHRAFFEKDGWARPYVKSYLRRMGIPDNAAQPLFVLCWIRYIIQLLQRLDTSEQIIDQKTADWLRGNRYYALWRHTVTHADMLTW